MTQEEIAEARGFIALIRECKVGAAHAMVTAEKHWSAALDEVERLQARPTYPHMCRNDHVEIGHADSEHERCPLCRALDEVAWLREEQHQARPSKYSAATEPIP